MNNHFVPFVRLFLLAFAGWLSFGACAEITPEDLERHQCSFVADGIEYYTMVTGGGFLNAPTYHIYPSKFRDSLNCYALVDFEGDIIQYDFWINQLTIKLPVSWAQEHVGQRVAVPTGDVDIAYGLRSDLRYYLWRTGPNSCWKEFVDKDYEGPENVRHEQGHQFHMHPLQFEVEIQTLDINDWGRVDAIAFYFSGQGEIVGDTSVKHFLIKDGFFRYEPRRR